jgi:hypothetical protein
MNKAARFFNYFWVNIALTICKTLVFIIGFALIFMAIYLYFVENDSFYNMATMLVGAATALSVVYLAEQLSESIRQAKIKLSNDYLAQYNSEAYHSAASLVFGFFEDSKASSKERIEKFLKDRDLRFRMLFYYNFFDSVAAVYNRDLLDKELIQVYFESIVITAFEEAKECIYEYRRTIGAGIDFYDWEEMYKDFKKIQKQKRASK